MREPGYDEDLQWEIEDVVDQVDESLNCLETISRVKDLLDAR